VVLEKLAWGLRRGRGDGTEGHRCSECRSNRRLQHFLNSSSLVVSLERL
jgi:hypothetical protein